ncbi:aldose epimerase [Castellaniella ginsengisoli]|uniref:Aldose epimerase n=1 Tax=Castellaniella ginsengisoli TaxID=546114 RepID=A0AB39EHY5_9BURK
MSQPPLYAAWMDAAAPGRLVLRHGPHRVVVAPTAGGRILRWTTALPEGARDWLAPIDDADGWPAPAWPKGGLFPLAPFSNRVRNARMRWGSGTLALETLPGHPHALHGQAQAMAWTVREQGADHAELALDHPAGVGGWPWAWRLRQTIRLRTGGLHIRLSLRNVSDTPMPAGLGLHPYFTATGVRLNASAEWRHEAELARASQPNRRTDWPRGERTWTAFLGGWEGRAQVDWRRGPGLVLSAEGPLEHLVLHANAGRYLCVEPATHVCDAANLAAAGVSGTGWRILAPDESLDIGLRLDVRPSPARADAAGAAL